MDTTKATDPRLVPLKEQAIEQFFATLKRWEELEEHAQTHFPDQTERPPSPAPVSFLPFRPADYIMTPEHPRWDEFLDRLSGPDGCNWTKEGWTCHGGIDKRFAAAILYDMGDIDVIQSLIWFEQNGGHCDCEILLNCAG